MCPVRQRCESLGWKHFLKLSLREVVTPLQMCSYLLAGRARGGAGWGGTAGCSAAGTSVGGVGNGPRSRQLSVRRRLDEMLYSTRYEGTPLVWGAPITIRAYLPLSQFLRLLSNAPSKMWILIRKIGDTLVGVDQLLLQIRNDLIFRRVNLSDLIIRLVLNNRGVWRTAACN